MRLACLEGTTRTQHYHPRTTGIAPLAEEPCCAPPHTSCSCSWVFEAPPSKLWASDDMALLGPAPLSPALHPSLPVTKSLRPDILLLPASAPRTGNKLLVASATG